MSAEDSSDGDRGENVDAGDTGTDSPEAGGPVDIDGKEVRERLEKGADRAIEQFDDGLVDLLSWLLDTETRARIFVHLRQEPHSTSDEIAEGTGLYPSTVREALAALHEEGIVSRQKRQNDGAGNNPYEYSAIPPSDLVGEVVDDVQHQLNTVFNLDCYLDSADETESDPVTITVREEGDETDDEEDSNGTDADDAEGDNGDETTGDDEA
jgi:predicted transcriptional regulator